MTEYGVTHIHPLALLATLLAGVALVAGRRSTAVLAFALVACLIPVAQRVVVASLDFNMIRILILFGCIRLFARGEVRSPRWNEIDVAFLAWTLSAGIMFVIREETVSALVYRLGLLFDSIGAYFLLRFLVRRPEDTGQATRYLAICAAIVMLPMTIEWLTGRNLFSIFGGVPAITPIREGRLRCQGAFTHPIMAGTFGASLVPVFAGMYLAFPRRRMIAAVGAVSGAAIAILAASSGALISLIAGLAGLSLWPLRRHMRAIRWGIALVLVVLHLVRDKPVWHLIARIAELTGGEGFHRYRLIDAFVSHWREWFLVGTPSTNHWGFMLWDTTNQYVDEGVQGGILSLIALVTLLALAFRGIGSAARARGSIGRAPRAQSLWCWGIGCGLFAHVTAFISVSYYGQMRVLFYLFLTLIAAEYSFAVAVRERRTSPTSMPLAVPNAARIE